MPSLVATPRWFSWRFEFWPSKPRTGTFATSHLHLYRWTNDGIIGSETSTDSIVRERRERSNPSSDNKPAKHRKTKAGHQTNTQKNHKLHPSCVTWGDKYRLAVQQKLRRKLLCTEIGAYRRRTVDGDETLDTFGGVFDLHSHLLEL